MKAINNPWLNLGLARGLTRVQTPCSDPDQGSRYQGPEPRAELRQTARAGLGATLPIRIVAFPMFGIGGFALSEAQAPHVISSDGRWLGQ